MNSFRCYTNLAAIIHLLQNKWITALDPTTWDDKNDSYFMAEYKRLSGAQTLLALCFAEQAETYHQSFTTRAANHSREYSYREQPLNVSSPRGLKRCG
jgi:hypothetical protein